MSFQRLADVFAYVKGQDDLSTSEVLTLVALAHHENSKTGFLFPSIATLRRTTKLSRRGQQRMLRQLEARGLVETRRHIRHQSSDYRLCVPVTRRVSQQSEDDALRAYRLHELQTMPYADYLLTPEWDEKRRAQLRWAQQRCQVCNTGNVNLHVHHRSYARLGEESPTDLIALCASCHKTFHNAGKLTPDDRE